ncbi:uncharacterized protein LOC143841706 [Paroedura picta]|uniref:uncharacterized protein LOC143841706 n=1 Tax=Paroedura picta TaxID=143630 RepID=UPI004057B8BE
MAELIKRLALECAAPFLGLQGGFPPPPPPPGRLHQAEAAQEPAPRCRKQAKGPHLPVPPWDQPRLEGCQGNSSSSSSSAEAPERPPPPWRESSPHLPLAAAASRARAGRGRGQHCGQAGLRSARGVGGVPTGAERASPVGSSPSSSFFPPRTSPTPAGLFFTASPPPPPPPCRPATPSGKAASVAPPPPPRKAREPQEARGERDGERPRARGGGCGPPQQEPPAGPAGARPWPHLARETGPPVQSGAGGGASLALPSLGRASGMEASEVQATLRLLAGLLVPCVALLCCLNGLLLLRRPRPLRPPPHGAQPRAQRPCPCGARPAPRPPPPASSAAASSSSSCSDLERRPLPVPPNSPARAAWAPRGIPDSTGGRQHPRMQRQGPGGRPAAFPAPFEYGSSIRRGDKRTQLSSVGLTASQGPGLDSAFGASAGVSLRILSSDSEESPPPPLWCPQQSERFEWDYYDPSYKRSSPLQRHLPCVCTKQYWL